MGSGDREGVPLVNPLTIREEQRSYETNFWLLPVPRWFGNETLATNAKNGKSYSTEDYDEFFEDISYPSAKKLFKRVSNLTANVDEPGVKVVCMYSTGVDTVAQLNWDKKGWDKQPKVINGDGDG